MKKKLILYYDRECPFCNHYASFLSLQDTYELHLSNARESLQEIHTKCPHLNINDGMIIEVEGNCLQGTEALAYLDHLISRKSLFAKLHRLWSLPPLITHTLYKLIKIFRKAVLFLIGKKSTIE
ncbi:DCC1-like thiol-disulfide oxidoreductase family protein [Sulfurovum sp. zt1-1]|uniref:DCC1-like thiol-disulfide oxidoreductase family protein n=1 Tax=Sulfurovum zhangzhouensis TaxID=3019067 RepID=A0ABT7QVP8_9BACT|nr:DCC1-like thiol-disulfide oxidoreductase family protein [Sulfurovum zhangzhouensis]MDM5270912.1 DCC1-like thiol-disulfide oxidoreductase family protein [Sulfurovum zhangzhouensis]